MATFRDRVFSPGMRGLDLSGIGQDDRYIELDMGFSDDTFGAVISPKAVSNRSLKAISRSIVLQKLLFCL